eukprot:c11968_g1_i2.p1 GENE.c11968_g1_i2~~c11968_g1_i2.p1  ORF type:complete len:1264 (+),score=330.27 c11968_g1_i2:42-3794(+)
MNVILKVLVPIFLAFAVLRYTKIPPTLFYRISRNVFVDSVPPPMTRRYPVTPDADLVRDVTIVVSAKDFLSQAPEQVAHLSTVVPKDIHVIYTYPKPLSNDTSGFESMMRAASNGMSNLEFMELDSFANPFLGWTLAAPLVKTKYTLFMHNDVYPLDEPGKFISELYQSLERHPECTATTPMIFEAEVEGMLSAHAINTNLHLRQKPSGVYQLSHEVDLLNGTSRQPEDFEEGYQLDFVEDHAFMMHTDKIIQVVDPNAAFTLEYMDMQMNIKAIGAKVWFIPSSRIEFRVWGTKFHWNNIPFFGYRRSERLARSTKLYLEKKWGVEFPNTGFANFVKFSVARTAYMAANTTGDSYLPPDWSSQVQMVAGWFEWIGFNFYTTPEAMERWLLPDLLKNVDENIRSEVHAGRELFTIEPVTTNNTARVHEVLSFLEVRTEAKNIETRLSFDHMALAVAKISFTHSCAAADVQAIKLTCGLLIETAEGGCTCWAYIAPYNYDHWYQTLFSHVLWYIKLPQRVAVYSAFQAGIVDFATIRPEMLEFNKVQGVEMTVCGEHDKDCEITFEFPKGSRLLQWSGALNSWYTLRHHLASLPGGEAALAANGFLHVYWATLALLFILQGITKFDTVHLQGITTLLCIWALLSLYGVHLPCTMATISGIVVVASLPLMSNKSLLAILIGGAGWVFAKFFSSAVSAEDALVGMIAVAGLSVACRIYRNLVTLRATALPTLLFAHLSHIVPAYFYSEEEFLAADGAPHEIVERRRRSFKAMQEAWQAKWPKSLETSNLLRSSFSDLRFASGNRVFLPFKKIVEQWCDPCTVVTAAHRMVLTDVDGHELDDISGSYGVNVCGHDKYKEFLAAGVKEVEAVGTCVLGPIHPKLVENVQILKKVSGMDEVSFHMSGTEAVMAAMRLARFNTDRRLIVLFNGAYHGWWDGVQSFAGNERTPPDVLTLMDMSPASLHAIKCRASEIAAVVINPLQSFHPNAPPPSDLVLMSNVREAGESNGYKEWLHTLRALCTKLDIPLVFDEVYTGFRLAPGGAQEYFKVKADMVCYGKTVGGGLPNGICCGSSRLMARSDPNKPLRVAYVIGTFSAHPLLVGTMNAFLRWSTSKEARLAYEGLHERVAKWVLTSNKILEEQKVPVRLTAYASVWTILYQRPGRYHWMLQYYLKDEGINLSWVGTGRLNFSLDYKEEDLVRVREKLIRACKRMEADGWWSEAPNQKQIKVKMVVDVVGALARSVLQRFTGMVKRT